MSTEQQVRHVFRTADYGVVGFLFARGLPPDSIQKAGRRVVFCFQNSPELLSAMGDYTSNAPVPCRDFFHGLRWAKSIIQETMHEENGSCQPPRTRSPKSR